MVEGELHRTRGEAIEGKPRPVAPLGHLEPGEKTMSDLAATALLGLEHDVIRRVLTGLERQSARIDEVGQVDPVFLATTVDFIDTYANQVHHGKEEGILFRRLHQKSLSTEDRQMMEVLARDHVEMRRIVGDLREAHRRYYDGEEAALGAIREGLDAIIDLYPDHIETEDEDFFPAAMDYLDEDDQEAMLEEMAGHDRAMIHEKYGSVAESVDAQTEDWAQPE
jgi:hemerythrin-like domain-containing protein